MSGTPLPDPASPALRRVVALCALAILVAVAAGYHNALRGAWVLDDYSSVLENPSLRRLWPPTAPPADAGTAGRPLANLSLAFDYAVSGTAPWSYRLGNIAFHAANALLLFGIVRRTLRWRDPRGLTPEYIAVVSGILWALHPLATAAVAYVAQRTEVLMACCYLATLYAVVRAVKSPARCWRVLAVLFCALGMASKETMVTAPIVILLFDVLCVTGSWRETWRARGRLHLALASTWLVLAALLAQSRLDDRGVGFDQGLGPLDYLRIQTAVVPHYFRLAAWPHPLVFDHGWLTPPAGAAAFGALAACVALLALAAWLLRTRLRAGFALAASLLVLAPTSTFVPIAAQPLAESRMYLPLAALVALAVVALRRLGRLAALVAVPVALVFLAATHARNALYHDEVRVWQDTVAKTPANARAHANLAAALLRAGRPAEARAAAQRATELRPSYAEAHNNLGLAFAALGEPAAALEHYEAALRTRPDWVLAHYNRGSALFQLGRAREAADALRHAVALDPGHARAHNNLSAVSRALREPELARLHAETAVRLDSTLAEAHYNLGNALADAGDFGAAARSFTHALELQPHFPRAHNNLGVVLLRQGDRTGALRHFEAALAQQPAYAEALRNRDAVQR